jgi:nitrous oxidase accessory protein
MMAPKPHRSPASRAALLLLLLLTAAAEGRTWRAAPDTGLGATVARAAAGDTVWVEPGVYREDSVLVDRRLTIIGRPGAEVDGSGGGHLMIVRADGVEVRGLAFRGASLSYRADHAALMAENCAGLQVEDCRFEDNFFGVYLARCRAAVIRGNTMVARENRETASGNGVHLWHCREVEISANQVSGHRDGIYLEFVRQAVIKGNHGHRNLRYGLHFMFSDSCHYLENEFDGNGAGVAVMYSRHVEMSGNDFHDNWGPASYGVLLKDISDSVIRGNTFRGNTTGLHVEASNRLRVFDNDFRRNGWALRLMANSTDGRYEDNRFVANAFDVAVNGRQNYSTFARNYWDRHRGYDLDRDGYGDAPHRPVSVFARVVEDQAPALVLLRSLFLDLLDLGERAFPLLTPPTLEDSQPRMREP